MRIVLLAALIFIASCNTLSEKQGTETETDSFILYCLGLCAGAETRRDTASDKESTSTNVDEEGEDEDGLD